MKASSAGAAGLAGFAERDLEVTAALSALRQSAGAEISECAHDCALELRPTAAHEPAKLRFPRIDENRGSFRELVRNEPFMREVPIEGV